MWARLLDQFLTRMMVTDRLSVTYPDGTTRDYGPETGERAHLARSGETTLRSIVLNPDLGFGEAFMDARVSPQNCTLDEVLTILIRNRNRGSVTGWMKPLERARFHARAFIQRNAPGTARRNVAHHFDLSDELYAMFLDEDMQYSCAYFSDPAMTLEAAQVAKKAHIAGKLRLEPGMRVLDIGCGWGGMAMTLARDHGCEVTGITLSENQLATAEARVEAAGLAHKVRFDLRDYRHVSGTYDRIVSVGMLEHVGVPNYGTYFGKVSDLLDPDGVALIHTIGRMRPPGSTSPWIDKYIFPGGYCPSLSEMTKAIEKEELYACDVEILRLHYAETLRHWTERFEANIEAATQLYDDRFCRMWRYYMAACEMTFRHGRQAVFQVQLAHDQAAVPLTRDYLFPAESAAVQHAAE